MFSFQVLLSFFIPSWEEKVDGLGVLVNDIIGDDFDVAALMISVCLVIDTLDILTSSLVPACKTSTGKSSRSCFSCPNLNVR